MVDLDLVPIIEKILDSCPLVQTVIVLTNKENMPTRHKQYKPAESKLMKAKCHDKPLFCKTVS